MNVVYLSLGSNQKSPERQLRRAISLLKTLTSTSITKISSFYRTKAWGMSRQQDFYNAVVEIKTTLSPEQLMLACQKIESRQGRVRKKKWGPRVIDIDILLYGSRRINSKKLIIPHRHMHLRDFVQVPLHEVLTKRCTAHV